jgi:hypothetical protein
MADVFNLASSDEVSSWTEQKKANNDGLLRPKLEEGKDGKRELVIRFLPNMINENTLGATAIEKHIHYANFKNNPELQGYYDCLKNINIGKDCPLCKTFWLLKNSKNPADQDKAKLISRTTKYYSYVLVVDDEQVPDNVGKIFIFPFGFKIYEKIKLKLEAKKKPFKVEDLIHGADFNLVIKEVAGFYNYDSSEFDSPEPITINGKQLDVNDDGSIDKSERKRIIEFLLSREHTLQEFLPVDWTPEQYDKVEKIISLLSGQAYTGSSLTPTNESKPLSSSNIFDDDDDDDDFVKPKAKTKAKTNVKVSNQEEEEEENEAPLLKNSKRKAVDFFDEE